MLKGRKEWVVALSVACLLVQSSCWTRDEAEALRRVIKKGATLAEDHDVGGLIGLTTEDFSALPGGRDQGEVRGILFLAFRHYRQFRILYPEPSIDLATGGEAASARVYFLIVRQDRSYPGLEELYKDPRGWIDAVGENADLYRLELEFVKKGGDWVARRARLEPFKGYGFGEGS
jgi:hypothetical protein